VAKKGKPGTLDSNRGTVEIKILLLSIYCITLIPSCKTSLDTTKELSVDLEGKNGVSNTTLTLVELSVVLLAT
jgi:hypothetical protein